MKILLKLIGVAVVGVLAFLLFWPVNVEPMAWSAGVAPPSDSGPFAANSKLAGVAHLGTGNGIIGPEAILPDQAGRLIMSLEDGRVVRVSADGAKLETLGDTKGRPLGLAWRGANTLIIADGKFGLVSLDITNGKISILTNKAGGKAIGLADYVVVSPDGRTAYFTDYSSRWSYGASQGAEAVIEHAGDGRLLAYDFATGETRVLQEGLQVANGLAFGPDDAFILVAETAAYRISRFWLKGEKQGKLEVFIDNLPGFPDNITFNGKDRFWVALFAPRNGLIDWMADKPFARKMLTRAMLVLPKPVEHRAMAVGLSVEGKVIANLQASGAQSYAPVTHVMELGDQLYFGSLSADGFARLPLGEALKQ
jgi:sugar lactone lactonase YvrE